MTCAIMAFRMLDIWLIVHESDDPTGMLVCICCISLASLFPSIYLMIVFRYF